MKTLDERIQESIHNNPHHANYQIAKNIKGATAAQVAQLRQSSGMITHAAPQSITGGIDLAGLKILPRKPAESASSFIKRLPENKGFELNALSVKWGIAEETIRRHAKELHCFKFVEIGGEWLPMVLNPKTAEKLNV